MRNKTVKAVLAAALIAAAQPAQAPTQRLVNPSPIEKMVVSDAIFGEYTKKAERKFYHSMYPEFPYIDEIPDIIKHARMTDLEPELLMAIRLQENGIDSVAYGILPSGKLIEDYNNDKGYTVDGKFYPYKDEKEKQLHWAARTVKYYKNNFDKNPRNRDFISYLGKIYAPIGVSNDPTGLNRHWIPKVKSYYKAIKKS